MSDELPATSGEQDFFQKLGSGLPALTEDEKKSLAEFEGEGMREESYGLKLEYPRVEILHAGAKMFKFKVEEKNFESFKAVIVHVEPGRVWWPWKFGEAPAGEEDGWPHCFSRDLITPDAQSKKPQSDKCSSCPQNEFGSDGRAKACKEIRRMFFIPEERLLPHWMAIPPSSLRALSRYLSGLVNKGVKRPQMVVTNFSLVNATNKDDISYSELSLTMGARVPESFLLQVKNFKEQIAGTLTSAAPVSRSEYAGDRE